MPGNAAGRGLACRAPSHGSVRGRLLLGASARTGELLPDNDSPDLPPRRPLRSPMGALTRIVDRRSVAVKSLVVAARRRGESARASAVRQPQRPDRGRVLALGVKRHSASASSCQPIPTRHFVLARRNPGICAGASRLPVHRTLPGLGNGGRRRRFRDARQPFGNASLTQTSYRSQTSGKLWERSHGTGNAHEPIQRALDTTSTGPAMCWTPPLRRG